MQMTAKVRSFRLSPGAKDGVQVPHRKNTAEFMTETMPPPEKVYIALQQHIGAPCVPLVKKGDYVAVGQTVGDSDEFISAPVHASVSGVVEGTAELLMPSGAKVAALIIASDGKMTPYEALGPKEIASSDDLIRAARECGLVGLGGAGFPTHVKLKSPPVRHIDTLIINAAECEPYITADYRECVENSELLMESVYMLLHYMAVDRIIIAIEDNKPEAIRILSEIADDKKDKADRVRVMKLRSRYPQGAEKVLIQAVTGRRVPVGKLPSDVCCTVMNITSVATLGRFIRTGMPLVSKRITVDGSGIHQAKNLFVPIGTPIKDIIAFCGGYKGEPGKILMGGPMMGLALADDTLPILKQNNAILVFDKNDDLSSKNEAACIRCGRCAAVCPMSLMPTIIERYAKTKDIENLKKTGAGVCMECGSCAFSCPACRPLVQYMRLAKQIEKEGTPG